MLPDGFDDVAVATAIEKWDPDAVEHGTLDRGEVTLVINPTKIVATCRFLRQERGFVRLSSVTATDWHPADPRFEVVYHLHSVERGERLRLKCCLPAGEPEIDSVVEVWAGANWYEREIYDLFGVTFRGHPNLRRLLLPEDWTGHPLRKDYPVTGERYRYRDE